MDINIIPRDTVLTPADETYIRNRLYFSLAASHRGIDAAEVSLCAVPGFESEGMHHCRVDISLADGSTVIGDSCETDVYVAIDRAVDRSCSKITSAVAQQWQAFSRPGTVALSQSRQAAAAYRQNSV